MLATMEKYKAGIGILCSCCVIFVILMSYDFLQTPTATWHLMQEPLSTPQRYKEIPYAKSRTSMQGTNKELTFPKRNVTEILANTRIMLEPYIKDIKEVANELRSKIEAGSDSGKPRKVFTASDVGYFEKVKSLPSVRTVFAATDFNKLLNVMNTSHFHYGSSDCIMLEAKGIYGKNWGKTAFNDTCYMDVTKYNEVISLNLNYLTLGLPKLFTVQYPQVVLTFIHLVRNAVIAVNGDVFVDRTKLLSQHCQQSKSTAGYPPKVKGLSLYNEVFTISQYWGSGFFHFMSENLVRISPYLDFLKENKNIMVHVNSRNSFTRTWLNTLGISKDRLVSGPIRASLLYMPAGNPCGRPTYFSSSLLSMNLQKSFGLTQHPRDTVVVIKRTHLRFFKNHSAIYKMVEEVATTLGFKVKLFSDSPMPSLKDTKEMFQRAVLILGPHGAGLSNMFLSQPGTVILEGLCNPVNLCYRNMAKVLGHRYLGLMFAKSCFSMTPDDIRPYVEYFLQNIQRGKR